VGEYPRTGVRDLVRLAGRLGAAKFRRADPSEALVGWLRDATRRHGSANIVLNLLVRRILFVSEPELSAHVLAGSPSETSFAAGTMKRKAMTFLAPNALTISHDDQWRALRAYNEAVLEPGREHVLHRSVLALVRQAFERPPGGIDDIRRCMGRVMLGVVFGEGGAPARLIDDIAELFAEVGLRTALFGSRKNAVRDRFYDELRRLWRGTKAGEQPSLLALARDAEHGVGPPYRREDVLVEQIPHWMFTFTHSGADLLARSLAMIAARPESLRRVREEIEAAGSLEDAANIGKLRYLEACILETGRLYPPVVQTAHRSAGDDRFNGVTIPAGTEMIQYFPFTNRDVSRDPLANHFRPDRWLDPHGPAAAQYPNLFLSGARACPGRSLVLLVIKAAAANVLRRAEVGAGAGVLAKDPLPFSFPRESLRFGTS